ncbi:sulfite exporter TauE/SafE family protein [Oceanidesulfovibrio indonesiensis]|uniref:Probable membrane transporter protein n=1 Tax=Oceanidesulfovibrio indonesiensis TaxID=54767 RepID=A0A7M3MHZ6_9BACT|nr:sulfite exporter TauE/SafE family protein [Oceanidesulfovibrio indonesiensis]TVM19316.1 sulfite exporter TauE/SafE family protein [Oceanidesulfovibrio indonesiensis]
MHFPAAGIEVAPWIPVAVAFGISLVTSMGGVSGAFLLLPFQMSVLGYTAPSVSATNQLFNVVATPGGVYQYVREGRMVWPLAWTVLAGTLPGVFAGAIIRVALLPDAASFKAFAALVLLLIGARMVRNLLAERRGQHSAGETGARSARVHVLQTCMRSIAYEYQGQKYSCSPRTVFALSLVVGILGGTYGIGGGAIMAPFLVAIIGLPVHTIAGVTLMATFATSVAGVAFYQALAPFYPHLSVAPDWVLGLLFGIGGLAGTYCGARLQKFVPAQALKWMLATVVILTALKYLVDFVG